MSELIVTPQNTTGLISKIRQCQLCQDKLPLPAKPILQFSKHSRILIAGQAPGQKTHHKGIPFDDASGERLRAWLGVNRNQFYDDNLFAVVPMGFCYPGTGKSGDLPPTPLCAATWRKQIMAQMPAIELTVILGKYAIEWHLQSKATITKLSQNWQTSLLANHLVLPHPSPRNNLWLKRNPWFEHEVIPVLKNKVAAILTK